MQVKEHPVEQEEVMAYLDGELPREESVFVAGHMEGCEDCQRLAAELRDVSRRLAGWQVEMPRVRLPLKRKRMAVSTWVAGVAAACVLIVLLVSPRMGNQAVNARLTYDRARSEKPMIARTSQLSLVTKEFDKARGSLEDILKRHRGYFGQLDVSAPADGPRTLTATLRVPADQLDPTMAEIKKLGQVESESQSGEDVTQQSVDLDARLTNARNTEQRLSTLLHHRTGQMTDVLAVEKELDRVRGEIEQMEAEKKSLVNRVDFVTLNVTLREPLKAELAPHSTWDRVRNAAANGYAGLLAGIVGVLLFFLSYGPSLLLWGGITLLIVRLVVKSWHRLKFGGRGVD